MKPARRRSPGRWWVYILECSGGRLYTGITNDVERRFKEHTEGKGARFTRAFSVNRLLYKERQANRGDALRREAAIKRLPRAKKLDLVRKKK